MKSATVEAIGIITTPYKSLEQCPRNIDPNGPICELLLNKSASEGTMGLKRGQKILILYWCHKADRRVLQQNSRRTGELAGVFALRTPNRPNPIAAAVLTIDNIDHDIISVHGLDCLDGTPLLDIKPAMSDEE